MPAFRPCGCSLLPQAFQWLLSNLFLFGCLPRPTTSSLKIWHQSWTSNTLSTQDVERITTALNSAVLSGSVVSNSETLWTVACQAPLSMEFSRQEYWSGLPCPPPGDLPNPGTKPRCPALQADSLPSEPPGKPRNTGVGSLSLLQGIFPTQELNWDLLHCRQILYQLSHFNSYRNSNLIFLHFSYVTLGKYASFKTEDLFP